MSRAEAATPSDAAPVVLDVAGTKYRVLATERITLEQDNWITAVLERGGLTDPQLAKLDRPARAREMRLRILESGRAGALLAGFLVQQGSEWSAEGARANAERLGRATGLDDRVLLQALLQGVIDGFFTTAESSNGAGLRPSSPAEGEAAADLLPDPSTSERSSPSSEPSGDSIPSSSHEASAGPSETPSARTSST